MVQLLIEKVDSRKVVSQMAGQHYNYQWLLSIWHVVFMRRVKLIDSLKIYKLLQPASVKEEEEESHLGCSSRWSSSSSILLAWGVDCLTQQMNSWISKSKKMYKVQHMHRSHILVQGQLTTYRHECLLQRNKRHWPIEKNIPNFKE